LVVTKVRGLGAGGRTVLAQDIGEVRGIVGGECAGSGEVLGCASP
jgi:hypothetical protein